MTSIIRGSSPTFSVLRSKLVNGSTGHAICILSNAAIEGCAEQSLIRQVRYRDTNLTVTVMTGQLLAVCLNDDSDGSFKIFSGLYRQGDRLSDHTLMTRVTSILAPLISTLKHHCLMVEITKAVSVRD